MVLLWSSLCLIFATGLAAEPQRYDGYSVIRAVPTNPEGLQLLKTIAEEQNSQVDFWRDPSNENSPVDMMVDSEIKNVLEEKLQESKIPYTTLIDDVQRAIEEEKQVVKEDQSFWPLPIVRAPSSQFFTSYHRLAVIFNFLDQLVASNPEITSSFVVGKSTQGRELRGVKVGSAGANKPAIWIDGGIHAREWISPATSLYILNQLVQGYATDADVKALVDKYDWYILPSVNPDGYEYTHTSSRLWRKTRSGSGLCMGTDANRNFGFHWMEAGASSSKCSDTYGGSKAFSEPETKALSDFIYARKDNIKIYLNVHSYSQLWLTPWGWTKALPKEYNEIKQAAEVAVSALTKLYGTRYTIGSPANVLYAAAGGAADWALGVAGIKYSYSLELRDTGRHGFVLPPDQIIPTGAETWEGVKALAKHVANEV